jgi:5'-3' exonuclease
MAQNFGKGCHLHLIDGSAFIFRAYHALPPLTRKSDGMPMQSERSMPGSKNSPMKNDFRC